MKWRKYSSNEFFAIRTLAHTIEKEDSTAIMVKDALFSDMFLRGASRLPFLRKIKNNSEFKLKTKSIIPIEILLVNKLSGSAKIRNTEITMIAIIEATDIKN